MRWIIDRISESFAVSVYVVTRLNSNKRLWERRVLHTGVRHSNILENRVRPKDV